MYTSAAAAAQVPLASFSHFETTNTRRWRSITRDSSRWSRFRSIWRREFLWAKRPRRSRQAEADIDLPPSIHTSFQGTAAAFQNSLVDEPWLILAAIVTVYIVLGVLYESYIHPVTILSTLPSAGVGAILALLIDGQ